MEAVVRIHDEDGTSEIPLKTIDELNDTTTRFDQAGIDYTLEFRKV